MILFREIKCRVCLLALSLLVATACAPSAQPTPAPAAQARASVSTAVPTVPLTSAPADQPSLAVVTVTPQQVVVPTAEPPSTPSPLNVQVKVDTQISASALISVTGGTLSVQDAEGTLFTLTFPKDALLQDTKVTLTPVTGVDGLPFSGGLVGGVQMKPEGLRLLQPATLTIESSKTVAGKGFETVAFAYHENGQGMYLSPSHTEGKALTLEIWHFSGAGAAQGTAAEIQTQQQQHVPSRAEDALAQRVQEYLSQRRQAQLNGQRTDPEFAKTMAEFAREWYEQIIAPRLPIALEDCEAAPEILAEALGWLRQVQLLGIDEDFQSERALIRETVNQAIVNCYNREYDQCVIDHDIKHRSTMTLNLRQAMLLGIDGQLDRTKIQKCAPLYQVDQPVGVGLVRLTGTVCALDKPFTLAVKGVNAGRGTYAGEFWFAPAGTRGGSWSHTATTTCLPEVGCGTLTASGTYQAEELAEGKVKINMNETTQTSSFGGTIVMPAWDFDLSPAAGVCPAK